MSPLTAGRTLRPSTSSVRTPSQPPVPRLSPSLPVSTYAHASVSHASLLPAELLGAIGRRAHLARRVRAGSLNETTSAAAADLTALASSRSRFFRRPLVRGALLVRSAPPLAGDLPLLLRGHRGKAAPLLAFTVHDPSL